MGDGFQLVPFGLPVGEQIGLPLPSNGTEEQDQKVVAIDSAAKEKPSEEVASQKLDSVKSNPVIVEDL
jgi:hypothetical protein